MKFEDYVRLAPQNKTIVNWWDLYPQYTAKLELHFKQELMKAALSKAGGKFTCLAREIGIGRRAISNYFKVSRGIPIKNLRKIMDYLGIPLEKADKEITGLGKLKPRFPFNLHSVEGAEIRAAFLSDGHVGKNPIKACRYHASEKELHLRLVKLCKSIFGEFETQTKPDKNIYKTYFPVVISFALSLCGVPGGDKIKANPFLPLDILLGNEAIQCAYLRRAFDDEGNVCFEHKSKRAVRISRSYALPIRLPIKKGKWLSCKGFPPGNLIIGEYLLLKKIIPCKIGLYPEGIYRALNNQITAKHRIQLTQRNNLEKFYKKIGFNLKSKNDKLKKAIDSYQTTKSQNGVGLKFALERICEIYHKNGIVKYGNVSAEFISLGRVENLAAVYLKKLVDMKILIKIRRGRYVFTRNYDRLFTRRTNVKDVFSSICTTLQTP